MARFLFACNTAVRFRAGLIIVALAALPGCTSLGQAVGWKVEAESPSLASPSFQLRIAALESIANGTKPFNNEAAHLLDDPHPLVRAAAIRAMASRGHRRAEELIAAKIDDHNSGVQLAAVAALGQLHSSSAREFLRSLLVDQSPRIRMAAVQTLGEIGDEELQFVLPAASDESWQVRREVASVLAKEASEETRQVAIKLLDDQSAAVQRAIVDAAASWPLEYAGEIWLKAMESEVYLVRKAATELLISNWRTAASFPLSDFLDRGSDRNGSPQDTLTELKQAWYDEFKSVGQELIGRVAIQNATSTPDPRLVARVVELLKLWEVHEPSADEMTALLELGPALLPILEFLALDQKQVLPESFFTSVLPKHEPIFADLAGLSNADVGARRQAATLLSERINKDGLPRLALARLAEIILREDDPAIWRRVMTAIQGDSRDEALRIAATAATHPDAKLRVLGCQLLGKSRRSSYVELLVKKLDDERTEVVISAALALGQIDDVGQVRPLEKTLNTTELEVQLAVAESLARLGSPSGALVLRKIGRESSPAWRTKTASAMSRTGDSAFLGDLIQFLDDEPSVRRAALDGLRLLSGIPEAAPGAETESLPEREIIQRWKGWYTKKTKED